VSRLSIQCEILNISQPYRPPRTVKGIALLYFKVVCDSRRGFWIGNWIYWTLALVVTIQFNSSRIYRVYSSVHHALLRPSLLCLHQSSGNVFSLLASPSSGFPNCPRASAAATLTNCILLAPLHTHRSSEPCCCSYVQVQVILQPMVSWPVRLGVEPPLVPITSFLLTLFDTLFLLLVRRPLRRDAGFVIFSAITHWLKSRRTHNHIFFLSHLRLTQPGGPGSRICIPQEQGGPVISPDTGSLFVVSYDSQGYGGGILTRHHAG
jgi:hypothetical protein